MKSPSPAAVSGRLGAVDGFTLIEVLVALVIVAATLYGIGDLQGSQAALVGVGGYDDLHGAASSRSRMRSSIPAGVTMTVPQRGSAPW